MLADMIRENLGVTDIHINFVDPVIGAHSGPGTLALFFLADAR
jgi:fatty acid-binding protein DegV